MIILNKYFAIKSPINALIINDTNCKSEYCLEEKYLLSLVCRSLELETYSRFSHEQLFGEVYNM